MSKSKKNAVIGAPVAQIVGNKKPKPVKKIELKKGKKKS